MKRWNLKASVGMLPSDTRVWLEGDDGERIDLPAKSIEVKADADSVPRATIEMHIESLELHLDREQCDLVLTQLAE